MNRGVSHVARGHRFPTVSAPTLPAPRGHGRHRGRRAHRAPRTQRRSRRPAACTGRRVAVGRSQSWPRRGDGARGRRRSTADSPCSFAASTSRLPLLGTTPTSPSNGSPSAPRTRRSELRTTTTAAPASPPSGRRRRAVLPGRGAEQGRRPSGRVPIASAVVETEQLTEASVLSSQPTGRGQGLGQSCLDAVFLVRHGRPMAVVNWSIAATASLTSRSQSRPGYPPNIASA